MSSNHSACIFVQAFLILKHFVNSLGEAVLEGRGVVKIRDERMWHESTKGPPQERAGYLFWLGGFVRGILRAFRSFDGLLQEEDVLCIGSKEKKHRILHHGEDLSYNSCVQQQSGLHVTLAAPQLRSWPGRVTSVTGERILAGFTVPSFS